MGGDKGERNENRDQMRDRQRERDGREKKERRERFSHVLLLLPVSLVIRGCAYYSLNTDCKEKKTNDKEM